MIQLCYICWLINPKTSYLVNICRLSILRTVLDGTMLLLLFLCHWWKWTLVTCSHWVASATGESRHNRDPVIRKGSLRAANIPESVTIWMRSLTGKERWWQQPFHALRSRETRRISVFSEGSRNAHVLRPPFYVLLFTPSVLRPWSALHGMAFI